MHHSTEAAHRTSTATGTTSVGHDLVPAVAVELVQHRIGFLNVLPHLIERGCEVARRVPVIDRAGCGAVVLVT
jgi:hypothetical protein